MTTVELRHDARMLEILWDDGSTGRFPYLWLLDSDPAGLHPDTKERIADLTAVPVDAAPVEATIAGDDMTITWAHDNKVTVFEAGWLRAHQPGQRRPDPANTGFHKWRSDLGADNIPRANADAVLNDDTALRDWLVQTRRYGYSIVEGLADTIDAGTDVAKRIGFLRETNFGLTFEVMSKPNPNNLAYTPIALPLHTDLTNQELPPGFQFLHCLKNEAVGGGSLFCDGYAIADDLRNDDPEAFRILTEISVPFRFHDGDTDIRSRKHVITLDMDGEVLEICFNAHIADVIDLPPEQIEPFMLAYRKIMAMTRDPKYVVSLKLRGGEMVVFDNRRVLHGREAFDPQTGARHLHGCYVDRGEFESRLRVLSR